MSCPDATSRCRRPCLRARWHAGAADAPQPSVSSQSAMANTRAQRSARRAYLYDRQGERFHHRQQAYSRNLTPESSGGVALTTPRNGLLCSYATLFPDTVVDEINTTLFPTVRIFPPYLGERSVDPQGSASPSPSGRNALRTMRCDHAPAGLTHRGAAHRHRHPAPARRGERAGQPAHQGTG